MNQIIEAPSHEYLEFTFVGETATGKGLNEKVVMEATHDGMFRYIKGRVGIRVGRHKPRIILKSMEEWDDLYRYLLRKGYLLTKSEKMEDKVIKKNETLYDGNTFSEIEDENVKEIVLRIIQYADETIRENYTIRVEDVSDEMIAYAKGILERLALEHEYMSIAEFSNQLMRFYAAIPRRIDNLSKKLPKRKAEFKDILYEEQELFDILLSQIRKEQITKEEHQKETILDAYGLSWRPMNEFEIEDTKKRLGSEAANFVRGWMVVNHKTKNAFEEFCKRESLYEDNGGIQYLFHGSRNENYWSIITNGLTINPTGVVITGKAFGNGTYFAPLAEKSMGYTSRDGSKWAHGDNATGFLMMCRVATGKRYHPQKCETDLTWKKLQKRCPGAHCTWAQGKVVFRFDEVIVYQNEQSTIDRLIELKAR